MTYELEKNLLFLTQVVTSLIFRMLNDI